MVFAPLTIDSSLGSSMKSELKEQKNMDKVGDFNKVDRINPSEPKSWRKQAIWVDENSGVEDSMRFVLENVNESTRTETWLPTTSSSRPRPREVTAFFG